MPANENLMISSNYSPAGHWRWGGIRGVPANLVRRPQCGNATNTRASTRRSSTLCNQVPRSRQAVASANYDNLWHLLTFHLPLASTGFCYCFAFAFAFPFGFGFGSEQERSRKAAGLASAVAVGLSKFRYKCFSRLRLLWALILNTVSELGYTWKIYPS